ncbi:MAG: hypothetical protein BWX48_00054 [Verrucomicrobia bacterium ADurb.Bin006]|mgnify:CR=1 FL=1|jgi:hypothetical protein|nr:MAG: hypothetical protein BWX48_00054 [Verrucomicrobia bacterium ADurb.Bin006]
MKQRRNYKMHLIWTKVAGLTAMFGIVTHWAAEDRLPDEACSLFSHVRLCPHKYPINPGMCKSDVPLCSGATSSNICTGTNITYYEVKSDFHQSEANNATMTCHQIVGGSGTYIIWTQHTKISSPPEPCYKRVTCRWDPFPAPGRCVVYEDLSPWFSLPKRSVEGCL